MSAESEKRQRRSEQFVEGYSEALLRFEVADETGLPMNTANPYEAGSEQARGFEEGWYDMTQK